MEVPLLLIEATLGAAPASSTLPKSKRFYQRFWWAWGLVIVLAEQKSQKLAWNLLFFLLNGLANLLDLELLEL